jgi:hypothetical protein
MAQTHSTPLSSSDWFLVSNKDSLSIKIRGSITIGEDGPGLLILNGSQRDERWFTLTVDHAGHLEVTDLMSGIHLEAPGKWSTNSAGAILPAGTVIAMPNNELYVSQDLQRGRAALKVKVTTQLALSEASEVPLLEEAANSPDSVEFAEPIVVSLPVNEPFPEEPAAPMLTERAERGVDPHSVPRWMMFTAPVLIFCVLAAGIYYIMSQVTQQAEPAATSVQAAAPKSTAPAPPDPRPEDVRSSQSNQSAENLEPTRLFKEVVSPIVPDSQAAPVATDSIGPVEASVVDVPVQLAKARRLLDQGYINWPVEQNAAFILGTLLASFPDLDEALEMLDEAAEAMIAQARGAYGDGFHDSAIRVLEEVMVFHPNYAPARELHMEWTRERQVQFIDSATQDPTGSDAFSGGRLQ